MRLTSRGGVGGGDTPFGTSHARAHTHTFPESRVVAGASVQTVNNLNLRITSCLMRLRLK